MDKQNLDFGRDKTKIIKGIAIIFMIIHHCLIRGCYITPPAILDTRFAIIIMSSMKLCVALFTFLVGYGYAYTKNKDYKNSINRIISLVIPYWIMLFAIFIPTALYSNHAGFGNMYIINNMLGLKSNLNWFNWYVYFYIYAMLILPLFIKTMNKKPILFVTLISGMSLIIAVGVHSIPNWNKNDYLSASFFCMLYTPSLFLGYFLACRKHYQHLKIKLSKLTIIYVLILFFAVIFARGYKSFLGIFDFLHSYLLIFCILVIFQFYKLSFISQILRKLGNASMYMWFLHALFFTDATRAVFQRFIIWPKSIILIILCTIILSYFMALGFMWFLENVKRVVNSYVYKLQ